MTRQAPSLFYDGKTSRAHAIELFLDTQRKALFFQSETQQYTRWELSDVSVRKTGSALSIQHGDDPIQSIVVHDTPFAELLLSLQEKEPSRSWYEKLLLGGFALHIGLALTILGGIIAAYIYFIPWVGEKSVAVIPESYDTKMGQMFFQQSVLFDKIDPGKTHLLNLFARRLKLGNTKPLKFTVVESPTVNAFALPDGNIVIYTGILEQMKSHGELVALIGHEASHVNHRHSMKMLCRNMSGYLFVSAILGDANGIMATIGDNVNSLQSLSFSREFERQADLGGFEIMEQNHIDPKSMPDLFSHFGDLGNFMPEFLSTHPMTNQRIAFINSLIREKRYPIRQNPQLEQLFKVLQQ